MSEAVFALLGAAIGVLGTLATALVRARREERTRRGDELRSACAAFVAAMARTRYLANQAGHGGDDRELVPEFRAARTEARTQYERLRLTSGSVPAQEAVRLCITHAYNVWE